MPKGDVMGKINILHLSDLHFSERGKVDINRIRDGLLIDLRKLEKDEGVKPQLIFFTGDLIGKGQNHEAEFKLALDEFIRPLLKALSLTDSGLFIVPGNHEVDRTKLKELLEAGLTDKLTDRNSLHKFYNYPDPDEKKMLEMKLSAYGEFKANFKNKPIETNYYYDVFKTTISNINFGIVCLNSAWRCLNDDKDEGRLIIGAEILEKAASVIKDCDIKIAISHHSFDMLTRWDKEDVQSAMVRYIDLFFVGHIHKSDFEHMQRLMGRVYVSTCAPLFSDKFPSGYSLLSLDLENKRLLAYLRRWYPGGRNEFAEETEKCDKGLKIIDDFTCRNEMRNDLLEIFKIRHKLVQQNECSLIIIPLDTLKDIGIYDVFVQPIITDTSNFVNKTNKQAFDLNDLLAGIDNLIFFGGKESGKTFLLNYIKDEIFRNSKFEDIIPVYIEFSKLPKNNVTSIIKDNIVPFLEGNCEKDKIKKYLDLGKIVIIIDDYNDLNDDDREKRVEVLYEFSKIYPKCRYIFSMNENLSQTFREESLRLNELFKAKNYYISPFNTSKIRELISKWRQYSPKIDVDKMVEQIVYCFRQFQIPVTPMAVTLFIGVLFRGGGKKNIKNEAYLIENYLQTILEKIYIKEDSEFDFQEKESFLAHIAYRMVEKNKFDWEKNEFEKEKIDYFDFLDQDVPSPNVFKELFDKGILQENNQKIYFNCKAWFNFFLAKKMQKEKAKMYEILNRPDYLRYETAIGYKAGLDRNDSELLKEIDLRTSQALKRIMKKNMGREFDTKPAELILLDFSDEIAKEIKEKNTDLEKDKIKDKELLYKESEELDELLILVTLDSDIVRNTTEIGKLIKQKYLKNSMDYYIYLMWYTLEEVKTFIKKVDMDGLKQILFRDDEDKKKDKKIDVQIRKSIERMKSLVLNIVPASVILYMADHLANNKLDKATVSIIKVEKVILNKLFYSLLLVKLNFNKSLRYIEELIMSSKSYTIDFIILVYLRFYCYENKLSEEMLNDVLELMHKIIKKYKANKHEQLPPFLKDAFISDMRHEIISSKNRK